MRVLEQTIVGTRINMGEAPGVYAEGPVEIGK